MLAPVNRKLAITLVIIWFVAGIAYVLYLQSTRLSELENELKRESALLNRVVSQRVDQQAAHLTSLSALAVSGKQPQRDLFLQVASAIRQFYPRVSAVDLVTLSADPFMLTTRENTTDFAILRTEIQAAAKASTGNLILLPSPVSEGNYLIVKRSPNSEHARFGLAIEIDVRMLLDTEAEFWQQANTFVTLALPDTTVLLDQSLSLESKEESLISKNVLSSLTQPLLLTTRLVQHDRNILTDIPVLFGLVLIAAVLIVIAAVIRLLSRTRSAELRARLGEHGARIAHASRVNSMGEIASGMAHELTQPLTAILSQSQAGLHLVKRGEPSIKTLEKILLDNVAQAKRADSILTRLRDWTRHSPTENKPVSLNECLQNVALLLVNESRRLMIDVNIQIDKANPQAIGDTVQIEQVIFNLMRNAMEALETGNSAKRQILMSSRVSGQKAIVEVLDNGPGIDSGMEYSLFEPFVTSKLKGMGLGLALCERIVERMDGELEIVNSKQGGVSASIILPLA